MVWEGVGGWHSAFSGYIIVLLREILLVRSFCDRINSIGSILVDLLAYLHSILYLLSSCLLGVLACSYISIKITLLCIYSWYMDVQE